MKIAPFPALRPRKNLAHEIASLPYDVMDTTEAVAMAKGLPNSFLHVVRSEIDLPPGTDPHAEAVYRQARATLDRMVAEGALVREDAAAIYLYRQVMHGRAQTAVVACCEIDDYANNIILRHEKTRQDKEDDRTQHILATNANTGQVFLTYREVAAIDWLVESECAAEPLYDFTAVDGVQHTVWKAVRTDAFVQAFRNVPKAYIADGHHRSAASFRAGMARREAAGADPDAEYNRFMACLFPSSQLKILPYNRCVRDLNGLSSEAFLQRVAAVFKVEDAASSAVSQPCSCAMYLGGRWRRLSWSLPASAQADPVSQLDVSRLQEDLLAPILGIGDPRTDGRIFFVGGIRGNDELVRLVDSGQAAVAFAMFPTTLEQMMAIADAGQTMPPKSTWFEPKLRSGLLVHTLD
jgi:uncharacterized protein (DUF1015 family)